MSWLWELRDELRGQLLGGWRQHVLLEYKQNEAHHGVACAAVWNDSVACSSVYIVGLQ